MSITLLLAWFLGSLLVLLISVPVAVTLVAVGVIGGLASIGLPIVYSMGSIVWGVQNEYTLTAIPLFILLGELLLRSGLADSMYTALSAWVGRLPGGLMHANMTACALFSATSGSSVATSATIGTVALPALQERNYPLPSTLGSLAVGGTLGILIPPSIALLVYGSMTSVSIGKLFIAGILPGILLTLVFMIWIAISSKKYMATVAQEQKIPLAVKLKLSRHLIPPAIVFIVVMGSIYGGVATPTESAGLGVILVLLMAAMMGRFSLDMLHQSFRETAALTGMIILIVVGAFVLNVTLSALDIPRQLSNLILTAGITPTQFFLTLIGFYIVLGMFLEVLSMQVTTIPIVFPIAVTLGIDPIWFGIFIVLMSEIALITPPVGMNIFVVQGVRKDGGPVTDVIRGVIPYVIILLAFTLLIWYVPEIVLWLPSHVS